MSTATTPVSVVVDGERVAQTLKVVGERLDSGGEMLLDFFFVQSIGPAALQALEVLAGVADAKKTKIILRGVNVEVYKVLLLARLEERFVLVN